MKSWLPALFVCAKSRFSALTAVHFRTIISWYEIVLEVKYMNAELLLTDLNRELKEMNDLYLSAADEIGISHMIFEILYYIALYGEGGTQKDICDYTHFSKSSVNSAMKKLVDGKYVYLQENYGQKDIYLTDRGRQVVREFIDPIINTEIEVVDEMGEEAEKLLECYRTYIRLYREKAALREE